MTWTQLLASNEVQRHKTSKKELDKLRAVIRRDLADASLRGASSDRRFATAYNAALQAGKMAIACAGYRVVGAGHHKISFDVVKLAIGKAADPYSDYFDRCRRTKSTDLVRARVRTGVHSSAPDRSADSLSTGRHRLRDKIFLYAGRIKPPTSNRNSSMILR